MLPLKLEKKILKLKHFPQSTLKSCLAVVVLYYYFLLLLSRCAEDILGERFACLDDDDDDDGPSCDHRSKAAYNRFWRSGEVEVSAEGTIYRVKL